MLMPPDTAMKQRAPRLLVFCARQEGRDVMGAGEHRQDFPRNTMQANAPSDVDARSLSAFLHTAHQACLSTSS